MAWSTDDLTKTHLDAGTDSPASARAELEALLDKVKLVLAEVDAGATVWHSGNDGATSGLDADLLDGQHGSYYRDANNINSGAIPLAHIPATLTGKDADTLDGQHGTHYLAFSNMTGTVSNSQLANDSVDQNKISAGAVHQGELDTGQGEVSSNSTTTKSYTLPGGEYGFYPNVKSSSSSNDIGAQIRVTTDDDNAPTTYIANITLYNLFFGGISYANQRYINSSPPHKIETIDYQDFIFVQLKASGDIVSCWIATDPPWYHNGPTKVAPNIKKQKGKKFRRDRIIPPELLAIKDDDPGNYFKELAKLPFTEYEITPEIKNADMGLIPHPFLSAKPDDSIVIIEPNQSGVYIDVCDLFNQGENVCEMIHNGYLKIDNTEIPTNGKPPNMPMHRIKWKKTK